MINSNWEFRWNEWNLEHIAEHHVNPVEAEEVVRRARAPFPEYVGDGKWLVMGTTSGSRYLRVIFIISPADTFYIIHAMDLSPREKRRLRRRRK